jgi:hypothetical protein
MRILLNCIQRLTHVLITSTSVAKILGGLKFMAVKLHSANVSITNSGSPVRINLAFKFMHDCILEQSNAVLYKRLMKLCYLFVGVPKTFADRT